METPDFLRVLQQFPETSSQEAEAVLTLKDTFPFSQVLHTMSARVSKDHELINSQGTLQLAAVYSADRAVLKGIMESAKEELKSFKGIARNKPSTQKEKTSGVDVASTVLEDLAKLHELRQNFELLFTGGPISIQSDIEETSDVTEQPAEGSNGQDAGKENNKSRKERIVQMAKTLTAPLEDTILHVEPGFKSRKRKKDAMDAFIDQIVSNKEELTPESDKHKEQIEIIEHFIKIQPSITGTKDKYGQNNDLSTIKTGEFGDHIISETLVEILLKQGKKEKAVEVLRKLIWKFPQKKAYFAAQIEELRK